MGTLVDRYDEHDGKRHPVSKQRSPLTFGDRTLRSRTRYLFPPNPAYLCFGR